jgi:hypothetical protein
MVIISPLRFFDLLRFFGLSSFPPVFIDLLSEFQGALHMEFPAEILEPNGVLSFHDRLAANPTDRRPTTIVDMLITVDTNFTKS